jgi:hypothetical protein
LLAIHILPNKLEGQLGFGILQETPLYLIETRISPQTPFGRMKN